ncbi:MAG: sugar phosphate isomerase/epimerase [Armatimonadota bacterium]|nr:sugar phosphate isomerase/epimerase [Armatimonadota bacterium]
MMNYSPERIAFAKRHGFKSLELMAGPGDGYFPGDPGWEAKADELKAAYAKEDLRISCVAGFYINHMEPGKEKECADCVRGTITLAKRLGVGVVAGFAGRLVNQPLEASLPKFKEIWGEHAKLAEDNGIKIAFENCPMGDVNTPSHGTNMMCTPYIWEAAFNEVPSPALGLEWDPSHFIVMFIDPIGTVRKFGSKIYHVHAKDAHIYTDLLSKYGLSYPGVVEGCFPGLGDTDWGACIKELRRQGYTNDLNIEGWHDHVFRGQLEDEGTVIGLRYLERFVVQD